MHIVPLIVGDERDTMRLCQAAIEQGVFAQAIRPPTVAPGSSRLRLAAMASHTASDMRMAASVLAKAAHKLGLTPGEIGTPQPALEAEPLDAPGVASERDEAERRQFVASAAGPTPAAPFDVEQPRPRRPPAPLAADSGSASAPFDGERESAVAHAA
jgi:hypothetical protein